MYEHLTYLHNQLHYIQLFLTVVDSYYVMYSSRLQKIPDYLTDHQHWQLSGRLAFFCVLFFLSFFLYAVS